MKEELKILKSKDLQNILGFGKTKMTELFQAGVLPVVKIGREYITTEDAISEWVRENTGKEIFF